MPTGSPPRLFTVRIWSEVGDAAVERRGQVRDVATGAFRAFRSWPELTAFLAERLDDRAPAGAEAKED